MPGKLNEEHIKKTAKLLGLPSEFIRKDFYVTKAIKTLVNVQDDYFNLIFQGGTSLSKGYQIIRRLSEDADFRVILKPTALSLSKEIKRRRLRDFRYALIEALSTAGFSINKEEVKVFYEGRFMSIRALFDDSSSLSYLKPHIAVECFVGELLLPPETTEISSLIKVTLGDECDHDTFPVNCLALDETAAEKWVALTRRINNAQEKSRPSDKHLVRHLYDLYHLNQSNLLAGKYIQIAHAVMQKDKEMFKKLNQEYTENPTRASKTALELLGNDKQWQNHWDDFLEQMVYEENKPSFAQAYEQLQQMSKQILSNAIDLAGVS